MNLKRELAALRAMSPAELRMKHLEVFGEPTRSGNRPALLKRIGWRLQANAEGGLTERARRRAEQLARESDVRQTPPAIREELNANQPAPSRRDPRLPCPGTVLTRRFKDGVVSVTVLDDGFEYAGQEYRSISAVAKAITGSHMNGYAFFGLARSES